MCALLTEPYIADSMRCSGLLVVVIETAGVLDKVSPFVATAYAPNVVYRSPNAACTALHCTALHCTALHCACLPVNERTAQ
jgi:hypothetical protein